jgi:hypothetical protein
MSYSQNFSFGRRPKLTSRTGTSTGSWGSTKTQYNTVEDDPEAAKADAQSRAFDLIMAGLDNQSNQFSEKLKGIYDGYSQYAKDYGAKAQPIMDALSGDISGMEGYIKNYGNTLAEVKDIMLNGIMVDPNATRTREQYQGGVAAAYAKTAEKQKQNMESQGLNPYANTGATRQTDLQRSADMASADNQAYSDWRTQYNKDVAAKGQLAGAYAGLEGKQVDMQGQLMGGRSNLLAGQKSLFDANLGASAATAAGYENLQGIAEQRRQEQLALAQQASAEAAQYNDLKQQQEAKLTPYDKIYAGAGGNSVNYGANGQPNWW